MAPARHAALLAAALTLLAVPGAARPGAADPAAAPSPAASAPVAAAPATAAAATAPAAAPAAPRPEGRELAGHVFMPALGVVDPFAVTSFGSYMTLGGGRTTARFTLQLPGSPPPPPQEISGDVSFGAVGGVLGYTFRIAGGVAGRVALSETIYSGTTGAAAAVIGTNARVGVGAGLTAGLPIGDSARLAVVFDASYAPRFGLLLGPALKDAYDSCLAGASSCQFDFSKLFEQANVLELVPGVAAAWAPAPYLGVVGNVSYAHSSIETEGRGTVSEGGVTVGAAVDLDLGALTSVPVGLQLTWESFLPVDGGEDARYTDLGGGVFYTGRKDLSLGMQIVDRRFKVVPNVDVTWETVLVLLGLRYYW